MACFLHCPAMVESFLEQVMNRQELRPSMALLLIAVAIVVGMAIAGARSLQKRSQDAWSVSSQSPGSTPQSASSGSGGVVRLAPTASGPLIAPTPDAPHPLPKSAHPGRAAHRTAWRQPGAHRSKVLRQLAAVGRRKPVDQPRSVGGRSGAYHSSARSGQCRPKL